MQLLFFFENAKNLGRSDDAKQRKKGMALKGIEVQGILWQTGGNLCLENEDHVRP